VPGTTNRRRRHCVAVLVLTNNLVYPATRNLPRFLDKLGMMTARHGPLETPPDQARSTSTTNPIGRARSQCPWSPAPSRRCPRPAPSHPSASPIASRHSAQAPAAAAWQRGGPPAGHHCRPSAVPLAPTLALLRSGIRRSRHRIPPRELSNQSVCAPSVARRLESGSPPVSTLKAKEPSRCSYPRSLGHPPVGPRNPNALIACVAIMAPLAEPRRRGSYRFRPPGDAGIDLSRQLREREVIHLEKATLVDKEHPPLKCHGDGLEEVLQ